MKFTGSRAVLALVVFAYASGGLWGCGSGTSSAPTAPPSPTVSGGSVAASPSGSGLASVTAFTFTAQGFSASDGSALTYRWEFGDGTTATGGQVTHVFAAPGQFDARVTGSTSTGVTASATLAAVRVVVASGRWGITTAPGTYFVRNTYIDQNGSSLTGDDTALNCRFTVTGGLTSPRSIFLSWVRPAGDCAGRGLPVSFSFSGTADDAIASFAGTLSTGAAAVMVPCSRPSCY